MNVAFPALVILLLVLPGAVFRYAYARGSWGWSSPISFRSMSDELAYSAVFAVGLHLVWASFARCVGEPVDFQSLVAVVAGSYGPNGEYYGRAIASIASHPAKISAYFLSLVAVAAVAGRLVHAGVRKTKLDLQTQVFRFKNEWHYRLTGEMLDFKEVTIATREIDGVFLSAIVDHGKDSYLYRGIVEDWTFDKEGQLDTIAITLAHRRLLSDDRPQPHSRTAGDFIGPDERYYEMHGDLFLLRYSQIKTLNLDYFALPEEQPGGDANGHTEPDALRDAPEPLPTKPEPPP